MNIRHATAADLTQNLEIYNQGIADRMATLETEPKDLAYMTNWLTNRPSDRYAVLVAEEGDLVLGYASLNPYSSRACYAGVADLSIYIRREGRGRGVGSRLLTSLEEVAREHQFHKIVLFTFPFNTLGQALYRKLGYREVGVFQEQGMLDGRLVDVMAMEKILLTNS